MILVRAYIFRQGHILVKLQFWECIRLMLRWNKNWVYGLYDKENEKIPKVCDPSWYWPNGQGYSRSKHTNVTS